MYKEKNDINFCKFTKFFGSLSIKNQAKFKLSNMKVYNSITKKHSHLKTPEAIILMKKEITKFLLKIFRKKSIFLGKFNIFGNLIYTKMFPFFLNITKQTKSFYLFPIFLKA